MNRPFAVVRKLDVADAGHGPLDLDFSRAVGLSLFNRSIGSGQDILGVFDRGAAPVDELDHQRWGSRLSSGTTGPAGIGGWMSGAGGVLNVPPLFPNIMSMARATGFPSKVTSNE